MKQIHPLFKKVIRKGNPVSFTEFVYQSNVSGHGVIGRITKEYFIIEPFDQEIANRKYYFEKFNHADIQEGLHFESLGGHGIVGAIPSKEELEYCLENDDCYKTLVQALFESEQKYHKEVAVIKSLLRKGKVDHKKGKKIIEAAINFFH